MMCAPMLHRLMVIGECRTRIMIVLTDYVSLLMKLLHQGSNAKPAPNATAITT